MSAVFEMPEVFDDVEPTIIPFAKSEEEKEEVEFSMPVSAEFFDFAHASECYQQYVSATPPGLQAMSLKKFWWASEKHIHGKDFVPWSFTEDHRWMKADRGEIVARPPASTEQAAEQTTEKKKTEHLGEDEKFWKELEMMSKLKEAELERQQLQSEHDVLKEQLKEAKDMLKAATAKVAKIATSIAQLSLPEVAKPAQPAAVQQANAESEQSPFIAKEPAKEPQEQPENNGWRDIPTEHIASGIPGVGKKKIEDLVEAAPTLGDLEDKRGEASKDFLPFKAVLPKGWGEEATDKLLERMLTEISKWSLQQPSKSEPQKIPDQEISDQKKSDQEITNQETAKPVCSEPDLSDL